VSSENFTLLVFERNPKTLNVSINQSVTIPWNASASQFCTQLNIFSWFGLYSTTCALIMKDSAGVVTTNSSAAISFTWRATIAKFRPAAAYTHNFIVTYTTPGGMFTNTSIQSHSPLITGTFTLELGGLPVKLWDSTLSSFTITDIPYNVDPAVLKQALKNFDGFDFI